MKELRGTPLSSKDFKGEELIMYSDTLKSTYTWDLGVGLKRYLQELKRGRIIARECLSCKRILLPPRMFCELCFTPTHRWVYVKDTGVVNTYSICYVNWDASRLKTHESPYLPAVIVLDGASLGMGILHLLGEVKREEIHIGMRVKAIWKKRESREGSITDIMYFKPLKEEGDLSC